LNISEQTELAWEKIQDHDMMATFERGPIRAEAGWCPIHHCYHFIVYFPDGNTELNNFLDRSDFEALVTAVVIMTSLFYDASPAYLAKSA